MKNSNKRKIDELKIFYDVLQDELNCLLEDSLYFNVSEKRIKQILKELEEIEKEIGVENDNSKSDNRME